MEMINRNFCECGHLFFSRLSVVGNADASARKYEKFEGTDDVEKGSTVGDNVTASTPIIPDKPRELSMSLYL